MARWSPSVANAASRDQLGEIGNELLAAAEIYGRNKARRADTAQREKDRASEDAYRQQVLQRQEQERQDRLTRQGQQDDLQRAELAQRGILYKPNPSSVYEGTGERVDVPTVPGVLQGFQMEGVRPREGMRVLGGGYYEDAARTPAGMAQAAAEAERKKVMASLVLRGYSTADADLIARGMLKPEETGPIAQENEGRARGRVAAGVRARALEEAAGDAPSVLDAARISGDYDEQTNQQLKLADQLVPNDPLWRPRTGADSANVRTADSLRTEAQGRMQRRPGILGLLRGSGRTMSDTGGTVAPAAAKSPAEWVADVRSEHPDWTPQQVADEARKRAGAR